MNNELTILDIVEDTIVDGPGLRTAIYAAGCPHRCPGCHNPQSWDQTCGHPVTVERVWQRIEGAELAHVTFSGGEPMMQAPAFAALARIIRERSRKTIWCYTGFRYEQVAADPGMSRLLPYLDVLVDGPFIEALKGEGLRFRGSRNQRLIDVPASLAAGHVVEYRFPDERPFPMAERRHPGLQQESGLRTDGMQITG